MNECNVVIYQGGNRFSPVNEQASHEANEIIYDETTAFSMQAPSTLNVHFTASYKVNKKESSRELALKILNLTMQPDFYGYQYILANNTIEKDLVSILIPNLSYKIEF